MYTEKITNIACGIRYKFSFSVLDRWGEIADGILYGKGEKYYGTRLFDNIGGAGPYDRGLRNTKGGASIDMSANQIVISQQIGEEEEKQITSFFTGVNEYIIPYIIAKYNLVVERVGYVFETKADLGKVKEIITNYLGGVQIERLDSLRFSRKDKTTIGVLDKNVNNYVNKIFTLSVNHENEKKNYGLIYDYQYYFDPPAQDIRDKANKIATSARTNFENDIRKKK